MKVKQHAKYLGQRLSPLNVFVQRHRYTQVTGTTSRLLHMATKVVGKIVINK